MNLIQRIEWRIYKEIKRLRLKNRRPTIIASNCIGTFIYYDMKIKYLSPTINLSFEMNDYVRFLENLEWHLQQPVVPYKDDRFDYPCGMIGDVEIRFNHYKTIEEAISKWEMGAGYPDVALLPVIAAYFGVSLDVLFDYDATNIEEKIMEILSK